MKGSLPVVFDSKPWTKDANVFCGVGVATLLDRVFLSCFLSGLRVLGFTHTRARTRIMQQTSG